MHLLGRLAVASVFSLALLAGCSPTTSVTETVGESATPPASSPTPQTVVPIESTATPVADELEDKSIGVVPFPPSENIVEGSETLVFPNPRTDLEDALAHPLARGLLDPAELGQLFRGQWSLERIALDESSELAEGFCDLSLVPPVADATSISASYVDRTNRSILFWLIEVADADTALEEVRESLLCAIDSAQVTPSTLPDISGSTQQFGMRLTDIDELGDSDIQLNFLGVTTDDVAVVIGTDGRAGTDGDAQQDVMARAATLVLERMGQS